MPCSFRYIRHKTSEQEIETNARHSTSIYTIICTGYLPKPETMTIHTCTQMEAKKIKDGIEMYIDYSLHHIFTNVWHIAHAVCMSVCTILGVLV